MREIKFRAWDIYKKVFMPNKVYAVLCEPQNGAFAIMTKDWQDYKEGEYFYPNAQTLFQYTGLKDKNGKEIYEGDIVVITIRRILEPCDLVTKEILPVYWSEFGSWNISLNDTLYDYNLYAEVIGNIYENPELLK